jgi:NitT/TauT family transport system substrate-binding protein
MDQATVERLLNDLEKSIQKTVNDIEDSAQLAIDLGMSLPMDVLMQAIPNSHLIYQSAIDSKSAIEGYFQLILDFNPNLIGGALPNDDFYHS